jgi:iron complex transport system substrate-binding protein|tara:strand:- start:22 stop:192 length:171 start_codon:yes stop_codon:yes gene_type:complete
MNYPQRIVCLTEETTETLYAIGAEDRIVGISGFTVRPERARAGSADGGAGCVVWDY